MEGAPADDIHSLGYNMSIQITIKLSKKSDEFCYGILFRLLRIKPAASKVSVRKAKVKPYEEKLDLHRSIANIWISNFFQNLARTYENERTTLIKLR